VAKAHPKTGFALRSLRVEAELTQRVIAERLSVHQSFVSMLERGKKTPTLKMVAAFADACGYRFRLTFRHPSDAKRELFFEVRHGDKA
jgi:transcriptional regulator with XRE-family HTH domain